MIRLVLSMSHPEFPSTFALAALDRHAVREIKELVGVAEVVRLMCQQQKISLHVMPNLMLEISTPYLRLKDYEALSPKQDMLFHSLLGESPCDDAWEVVNKTGYSLLNDCPDEKVPGCGQLIVKPGAFYWLYDGYFSGLIPLGVLDIDPPK